MNPSKFDVAIVGAGPTGSVLAILLARLVSDPSSIILFQSEQRSRYGVSAREDQRVIAINEGTRVLLEDLGAWPDDAAAITTIHVSQSGRLGRTVIRHDQMQVPALGYVVRYASLYESLQMAAERSRVTIRTGAAASLSQDADSVLVDHEQYVYRCRLGVKADGMRKDITRETYDQVALIGQVTVTSPKPGWAFERFTRQGPFAILPHPQSVDTQSIVWCCSPERAREILALETHDLSQAMQQAFGDRLGTIIPSSTPLASFALYKSYESEPVQGRLVSIGNAAQTLHPVAGQGLNLGLRDAATLAHCLRDWIANPGLSPDRALALFARLRSQDRQMTSRLTDIMSKVFTTGLAPLEHAAGLTLLGLDLMPGLRAILARQLMQGARA